MVQSTQENGGVVLKMALEYKSGQTAQSMKENGNLILLMALEFLSMLTATATKETGSMVKLMVGDSILTQMGHFITENGRKTYRMAKALRNGLMVPSTRVSMQKGKNVAKENL